MGVGPPSAAVVVRTTGKVENAWHRIRPRPLAQAQAGGGRLKLHDVEQPFTRKVALSHWLDCIFSNCPTLAICFHRNGRVLGYHCMQTCDIPKLKLRDLPVLVLLLD